MYYNLDREPDGWCRSHLKNGVLMNYSEKKDVDEVQETIIAPDVEMKGELITDNDVRVRGTFEGVIRCNTLTLEEDSIVKGDVDAESIHVSGLLNGNATANNMMISKYGVLDGEFVAHRFGIEPGAKIRAANMSSPDEVETSVRNPSNRMHPRVVVPHNSDKRQNREGASRPNPSAEFVRSSDAIDS